MLRLAVVTAVLLATFSLSPAATLKVWLEADPVSSGEYDVRIYAQTFGLDPAYEESLADMAVTVYTPDSVGITVPKYVSVASTTRVDTTWNPDILPDCSFNIKAAAVDVDSDGDLDASQMAVGTPYFPGLDLSSPTLLATERWIMLSPPGRYIDLAVRIFGQQPGEAGSRFWTSDATKARFSEYNASFDEYQAIPVAVPEPVSLSLLTLGAAGLLCRRKRTRR